MVKKTKHYERLFDLKALLKKNSFFLFGPRATGKSYHIKKVFPSIPIFDLLDEDVYGRLVRRPKQLSEEIPEKTKYVVIDEIQKCPALLDEVHRLIEKRGIHFLLTGSSARKLKRGGANMLGGRAWEAHYFPLLYKEIEDFNLNKYLTIGGLPRIYLSEFPDEELKAYVHLYVHEEIKAEALTRKIENFVRFLDVMALSNGKEINYQKIATDSGVPPRTIENYIEILKDTLMGIEINPFLLTKKRKAITRGKFYFFDIGVVNYICGIKEIPPKTELFGNAFEHWLVLELNAWNSLQRKDFKLSYWRSVNGQEVDLILGKELALEFKSSSRIVDEDLKGLKALKEEGLIKKFILISQDKINRQSDGVELMYWKDFLNQLWDGKIL